MLNNRNIEISRLNRPSKGKTKDGPDNKFGPSEFIARSKAAPNIPLKLGKNNPCSKPPKKQFLQLNLRLDHHP